MASPYRRKNSRNYYIDIWSHGKRQTIALGTDNYGVPAHLWYSARDGWAR
jgi:hypothetical protein